MEGVSRVGPLFLVASGEPGMAGFVRQVHVQVAGSVRPPILFDQEVLITDGPTVVAGNARRSRSGTGDGLRARVKGHSMDCSAEPAPTATF
jgi:hypothetical protein